jgi:hypothetical protein
VKTDELITSLSMDLDPVPPGWAVRTLALGALAGTGAAALLWLGPMGIRPDLTQAATAWPFWIKFFYTLALALAGFWLAVRAGRPGSDLRIPIRAAGWPFMLICVLAGLALCAPKADTHSLVMGHSALFCPFAIVVVSLPVLTGALWSLKKLAPTNLAGAGAAAGLLAGGAGAFVYAFYCTESATPFVAFWYTVGILLTAILGALLGRSLLRW